MIASSELGSKNKHWWSMEEAESTSTEEFYDRCAKDVKLPAYNSGDKSPEYKAPAPVKHDDFFDLFKR